MPTGTAFALRSAKLTTVALLLETADPGALAAALEAQASGTAPLFENDPVIVDLAKLREADAPVAWDELLPLLRRHGMVPVAVRGGSAAQMEAAQAAGLIDAPEGQPATAPAPAAASATPAAAPAQAMATPIPPVIVDRPLRSGQQVYARGTDLIVLGLVSHGAEVIADGHIHVYAPLRGRAIAGARGDPSARIFTTCLEAQLVSIAGTYRTAETPLPDTVLGRPAQVRLDGERLVVEPLNIR
ncbi:MAG TPA: septum site-determining protein MinC [Burkholderiaceae bacterium]